MNAVTAYAATHAGAPLERTTIERRPLGAHDVVIEIRFTGICHSDIHAARGEFGGGLFPMVPGHEIVGVVAAVGESVSRHAVGDGVGVGCMVDSCRSCENCEKGLEQYCLAGMTPTYGGRDRNGDPTYGGYSTHITVDEDFVVRIPVDLLFAEAAPLLCAGITLYSPLRHWNAGPAKQVAIVGMGGLGHLGVKIAHAMGAEVTVLSQSLRKRDDGLKLGADHFHATSEPTTFKELRGRFDLIINTVSASLDFDAYMSTLKVGGTFVSLGAVDGPLSVRVPSLSRGRKSIAGSLIGGIAETQEMLDFCAEHGIGAEIELITASQINEAYEWLLAGDVRYRFVIDNATI
jgi:uncharacterized zinc-type alcohol dehydrogenase-like protein